MRGLLLAPPLDVGYQIHPPLGLLNVYSAVEKEHEVTFHDLCAGRLTQLDALLKRTVEFVGLTCSYTTNARKTFEAVGRIRERQPAAWIIGGGNHATFAPEHLLRNGFDIVVRHEGEVTFPELLRHLEQNGTAGLREVPGIVCRENGLPVAGPVREYIRNLDELPFPNVPALDFRLYRGFMGERPVTVETSRGCPYRCRLCSTTRMWGNRWRCKSAERVAEEFRYLRDQGVDQASLSDDNYAVDLDRAVRICELLIEQGNRIRWAASLESSLIVKRKALLELMRRAGCELVIFSVDSANEEIIRGYRRPHDLSVMTEALEALRRSGMVLVINIILGYPGETSEQMRRSVSFSRKYCDILTVGVLEPRPGCDFWEAKYEDRYDQICQGYSLLHETPKKVERLQKLALLGFYFSPRNLYRAWLARDGARRRILRMHYFVYYKALFRLVRSLFRNVV